MCLFPGGCNERDSKDKRLPTMYGLHKNDISRWCIIHKLDGSKFMRKRYCQHEDCDKTATHSLPGKRTTHCKPHSIFPMIKTPKGVCSGCGKDAIYAKTLSDIPTKCAKCFKCLDIDMINVDTKKCEFEDCETDPLYGYRDEGIRRRCKKHIILGMVDVKNDTCEDCGKRPSYGYELDKIPRKCEPHSVYGMINVTGKRCNDHSGCTERALYGLLMLWKALKCKTHKTDEMIDVVSPRCGIDECMRHILYGYELGKPERCSTHLNSGMINLKAPYCKLCLNSKKVSRFGYSGKDKECCTEHVLIGMLLDPRSKCLEDKCGDFATCGNSTPNHCEKHIKNGEISLIYKLCKICEKPQIVNSESECCYCNSDNLIVQRLAKQRTVEKFLSQKDIKFESTDVSIDHGKYGNERPDFLYSRGNYHIVIEVDENQHNKISKIDEIDRMKRISQSLKLKSSDLFGFEKVKVLFIRYNPDIFRIKKEKVYVENSIKLEKLDEILTHYLKNEPDYDISTIYLYYDEYDYGSVCKNIE